MVKSYTKSAKYYDLIYQNKSSDMYEGTIKDFLNLSDEILGGKPEKVIDIGCGTGFHAINLAKRGIKVTGVDLSSEQLSVARANAEHENLDIKFIEADMANELDIDEKFDAGAAFFSSFCYLLEDEEVISFLNYMREIIEESGFLYFEFWNILALKPGMMSYYEVEMEDLRLLRLNTSSLDLETGVAFMPMKHIISRNDKIIDEFVEDHYLRCYTIPQLKTLINQTKWKVQEIYAYDENFSRTKPGRDDFRYYAVLT